MMQVRSEDKLMNRLSELIEELIITVTLCDLQLLQKY